MYYIICENGITHHCFNTPLICVEFVSNNYCGKRCHRKLKGFRGIRYDGYGYEPADHRLAWASSGDGYTFDFRNFTERIDAYFTVKPYSARIFNSGANDSFLPSHYDLYSMHRNDCGLYPRVWVAEGFHDNLHRHRTCISSRRDSLPSAFIVYVKAFRVAVEVAAVVEVRRLAL